MSKSDLQDEETTLRDGYDFSQGVRGKYVDRVAGGTNVIVLAPDVAAEFKDEKDEKDVNRVLRAYLKDRRSKAVGE